MIPVVLITTELIDRVDAHPIGTASVYDAAVPTEPADPGPFATNPIVHRAMSFDCKFSSNELINDDGNDTPLVSSLDINILVEIVDDAPDNRSNTV